MKKTNSALSVKILTVCLCLVVVSALIISFYFISNINDLMEENIENQASVTMQYLNADFRRAMSPNIDLVRYAAAIFYPVVSNFGPDAMEQLMIEKWRLTPDVFVLYYGSVISRLAPGGLYLATDDWEPPVDWDPPARPWHQAAMASPDRIVFIDPHVDAATGELIITIAQTVRNANGYIIGVMAADVKMTEFTRMVLGVRITEDGSTFLIDGDGLFIVHPNQAYVMTMNIFHEIPALNRDIILRGEQNVLLTRNNYICSIPLAGTDWVFVFYGPLTYLQETHRRILFSVVIVVIGIILSLGLLIQINRKLIS